MKVCLALLLVSLALASAQDSEGETVVQTPGTRVVRRKVIRKTIPGRTYSYEVKIPGSGGDGSGGDSGGPGETVVSGSGNVGGLAGDSDQSSISTSGGGGGGDGSDSSSSSSSSGGSGTKIKVSSKTIPGKRTMVDSGWSSKTIEGGKGTTTSDDLFDYRFRLGQTTPGNADDLTIDWSLGPPRDPKSFPLVYGSFQADPSTGDVRRKRRGNKPLDPSGSLIDISTTLTQPDADGVADDPIPVLILEVTATFGKPGKGEITKKFNIKIPQGDLTSPEGASNVGSITPGNGIFDLTVTMGRKPGGPKKANVELVYGKDKTTLEQNNKAYYYTINLESGEAQQVDKIEESPDDENVIEIGWGAFRPKPKESDDKPTKVGLDFAVGTPKSTNPDIQGKTFRRQCIYDPTNGNLVVRKRVYKPKNTKPTHILDISMDDESKMEVIESRDHKNVPMSGSGAKASGVNEEVDETLTKGAPGTKAPPSQPSEETTDDITEDFIEIPSPGTILDTVPGRGGNPPRWVQKEPGKKPRRIPKDKKVVRRTDQSDTYEIVPNDDSRPPADPTTRDTSKIPTYEAGRDGNPPGYVEKPRGGGGEPESPDDLSDDFVDVPGPGTILDTVPGRGGRPPQWAQKEPGKKPRRIPADKKVVRRADQPDTYEVVPNDDPRPAVSPSSKNPKKVATYQPGTDGSPPGYVEKPSGGEEPETPDDLSDDFTDIPSEGTTLETVPGKGGRPPQWVQKEPGKKPRRIPADKKVVRKTDQPDTFEVVPNDDPRPPVSPSEANPRKPPTYQKGTPLSPPGYVEKPREEGPEGPGKKGPKKPSGDTEEYTDTPDSGTILDPVPGKDGNPPEWVQKEPGKRPKKIPEDKKVVRKTDQPDTYEVAPKDDPRPPVNPSEANPRKPPTLDPSSPPGSPTYSEKPRSPKFPLEGGEEVPEGPDKKGPKGPKHPLGPGEEEYDEKTTPHPGTKLEPSPDGKPEFVQQEPDKPPKRIPDDKKVVRRTDQPDTLDIVPKDDPRPSVSPSDVDPSKVPTYTPGVDDNPPGYVEKPKEGGSSKRPQNKPGPTRRKGGKGPEPEETPSPGATLEPVTGPGGIKDPEKWEKHEPGKPPKKIPEDKKVVRRPDQPSVLDIVPEDDPRPAVKPTDVKPSVVPTFGPGPDGSPPGFVEKPKTPRGPKHPLGAGEEEPNPGTTLEPLEGPDGTKDPEKWQQRDPDKTPIKLPDDKKVVRRPDHPNVLDIVPDDDPRPPVKPSDVSPKVPTFGPGPDGTPPGFVVNPKGPRGPKHPLGAGEEEPTPGTTLEPLEGPDGTKDPEKWQQRDPDKTPIKIPDDKKVVRRPDHPDVLDIVPEDDPRPAVKPTDCNPSKVPTYGPGPDGSPPGFVEKPKEEKKETEKKPTRKRTGKHPLGGGEEESPVPGTTLEPSTGPGGAKDPEKWDKREPGKTPEKIPEDSKVVRRPDHPNVLDIVPEDDPRPAVKPTDVDPSKVPTFGPGPDGSPPGFVEQPKESKGTTTTTTTKKRKQNKAGPTHKKKAGAEELPPPGTTLEPSPRRRPPWQLHEPNKKPKPVPDDKKVVRRPDQPHVLDIVPKDDPRRAIQPADVSPNKVPTFGPGPNGSPPGFVEKPTRRTHPLGPGEEEYDESTTPSPGTTLEPHPAGKPEFVQQEPGKAPKEIPDDRKVVRRPDHPDTLDVVPKDDPRPEVKPKDVNPSKVPTFGPGSGGNPPGYVEKPKDKTRPKGPKFPLSGGEGEEEIGPDGKRRPRPKFPLSGGEGETEIGPDGKRRPRPKFPLSGGEGETEIGPDGKKRPRHPKFPLGPGEEEEEITLPDGKKIKRPKRPRFPIGGGRPYPEPRKPGEKRSPEKLKEAYDAITDHLKDRLPKDLKDKDIFPKLKVVEKRPGDPSSKKLKLDDQQCNAARRPNCDCSKTVVPLLGIGGSGPGLDIGAPQIGIPRPTGDLGPAPYGSDLGPAPYGPDLGPAPYGPDRGPAPYGPGLGPAPYGPGLGPAPYGPGLGPAPYGPGLGPAPYGADLGPAPVGSDLDPAPT